MCGRKDVVECFTWCVLLDGLIVGNGNLYWGTQVKKFRWPFLSDPFVILDDFYAFAIPCPLVTFWASKARMRERWIWKRRGEKWPKTQWLLEGSRSVCWLYSGHLSCSWELRSLPEPCELFFLMPGGKRIPCALTGSGQVLLSASESSAIQAAPHGWRRGQVRVTWTPVLCMSCPGFVSFAVLGFRDFPKNFLPMALFQRGILKYLELS